MVTMNKKGQGFLIIRIFIALWVFIGALVLMVVLHPIIHALVSQFLLTSTDTLQNFAVRMIETFFVGAIFIGFIITIATGE